MKANCSPVKDGRRYNSVLDAILALDSNSFDSVIKKFNEIPENNAPLIKREFHGKIVFCNYGSGKTFASSLNKLQFADDKFLSAVIQYVNNPGAVLPETIIPNHYLLESDYLFERIAGFSADQFEEKNYKTEYEPNMVRTAKAMNILAKNGYTIATNVTYSQYMESGIISKENCSAIYNASNIELSTVVKHRAQLENKKAIDYEAIEKKNNQLKELEGKLLEGRFLDVTHSSKRDIGSVLFEENRWSRWNLMNQRVNSCIERYGITEVQKALHEIAVSYINTIENNPNISKKVKNKFGAIENYAVYEFLGDTKKNTLQVIREQGSIELDNQTRKNIMRFFFDNKNIEDLKPILEECKKNNVVPIVRISLKQDHNEIKSTIESLYNERLLIPMNTSIFDSQDTFFRDKLFVLPKENDEQTTSILYEILTGTPAKLKELGGITYIDSKIAPSTEFLGKEGIIPEPQGEVAETPLLQKKENPIITIDSKDKNGQAASLYADKLIKEKGITNEDILYIDESFTKLSFSWLSTTINGFLQRGNKIIIGKSNPFYNYYKENLVFPNVIETEIKEKDSTLAVFFLPVQKNDSQGIKESTGKETTSIVSESKQKLFDEFLESSFAKRERDKMVNASYTFKDGTTVENLKYEPGEQQKEALSKIEDFIDNDKKYFVLKGYAGTGKTTIAKIIADKLSQEGRPFFFTASTNTAAGVLKKSVNEDVQTYQHLFGFIYKQGKKGGESIESVGYDIEKHDIPSNFVLLVDESSMITDSDFKKLSEILDKKNGKVIFLGDSAQLRPVQNKASNTKSKIFRLSQEEGFDSGTDMLELTDVMRNSGAILKEATRLRGKDGKPNTRILTHSMIDKDNRGIIVTRNENDELRKYVEKILKENNGQLNDNVFKALAFTNERTNQLNEEIRRYFHNFNSKSEQPISRLPIKGDYLTLNQNLEDKDYIYFAKGDTIQVDEVTGISKQHIKFKKGESVNEFDLTVTNYAVIKGNTRQTIKICDIDTEDINKTPEQLEIAKSNKKTLMEYKNNASLGENGYNLAKNYGIFLNADLPNLVKDEKTGNIKVDQKVKARSRTISFGYAMTIHKSQGQTLNNVVIDEDDIVSKTFDKEFKGELLYTAFTRAKDSVLAITSSASTIDPTKGEYENFEISTTINGQTIAKTNQEKWQQVSSIYSGPYKELASRVFDTCSKLDINLEQVTSDFIESNTELANRGYFRPDQNTVFISQYHQNNSEVLLHEAIHALTSWAIDNVETINDPEITIAVNNIKDIYKALRLNGLNLTNEKELVAELSSTKVRKEIERLSLTDTVINAVKKICSRLFGKTDKYAPTDALAILEDSLDTILRKVNKEQIEANVEREKNRSIIMTYLAKHTQDERDAIEYHHLIDGRFIDNEGKDLSDKKLKEIANSIGSKEVKLFNYDPSNNIYDEYKELGSKQDILNKQIAINNLFNENENLANAVYEALGFNNGIEAATMPFSPDNPEAIVYGIGLNGDLIGEILVDNTGRISSSVGQAGVELQPEYIGKGYGVQTYLSVARALAKQGKTLKSENLGKSNINDAANRVWKSLIDSGYAVDRGDYYEIINLATPQQKQRALQLYSQYLEQNPNGSAEGFKSWVNTNQSNVQYQLPQNREQEEFVASEKTIRDLAARISDRIGIPVKFESDRTKEYKGKLENNTAVVNLAYATLDTPIHEILGHPIIRAIKNRDKILSYNEWVGINTAPEMQGLDIDISKEAYDKYVNWRNNTSKLYQNLLKELEYGKGKEVFDRIKKDYNFKGDDSYSEEIIENGESTFNIRFNNSKDIRATGKSIDELKARGFEFYTLEEQQEEAIVELLGLYTADRLDKVKDGKLISLLKRLLKEMKAFVRSLLNQKEVEIDKLPDNMTLGYIADLLAYSNSKLILPGYEVIYTTPDNQQFKTYAEASNHISQLAKNVKDVDLDKININDIKIDKNNLPSDFKNHYVSNRAEIAFMKDGKYNDDYNNEIQKLRDKYTGKFIVVEKSDYGVYPNTTENQKFYNTKEEADNAALDKSIEQYKKEKHINGFIEKNKEYEQSKEIIEEWKKVNDIQYNPEEVYSRGQEFVSVVGAYSNFDVNLMMQNLLQHIEDNEKAGGKFAISAFTKPIDRLIPHLEGGGGKIKFKIYPQSNDILWAAYTDVFSGSVWDASEKVSKDKKSELLGVSYTKYPSLSNVNKVQLNLASIIDDLEGHHNELGISLTGSNFRLEYDEDIPYSTKKIIDSINAILDQKYGKLVKPETNIKGKTGKKYELVDDYGIDGDTQTLKTFDTLEEAKQAAYNLNKKEGYLDSEYGVRYSFREVARKQGIQPTQTNETLKESIESVKSKNTSIKDNQWVVEPVDADEFGVYTFMGKPIQLGFSSIKEANEWLEKNQSKEKEYTEQALINTKIARLKEVSKKYPRSLIRSEVKPINSSNDLGFNNDELPFQKLGSKDIEGFKEFVSNRTLEKTPNGNTELFPDKRDVVLKVQNRFTVKPIQAIDKKAVIKASVATQFIGFGEGIAGSSTALYAKQISEQSNNITPKANIPQNLVSGVESFGTKQEANNKAKELLGDTPHSIDMIEAGIRTRTTRSVKEMQKYNVKVGDIVKQFGKSADGTTKNILTRVTAIHPKGTPGFFGTWEKEGWTTDGVKAIERYKDGAAAIEFEVIKSDIVNSGNYSSNDVIFVSIGGKRGNEQIRKEQQDRTIKEALKAIEAGATLITDNKSYVESSTYNEGEKRLAKNLEYKGYNYSEQTVDGQVLGIWKKEQERANVSDDTIDKPITEQENTKALLSEAISERKDSICDSQLCRTLIDTLSKNIFVNGEKIERIITPQTPITPMSRVLPILESMLRQANATFTNSLEVLKSSISSMYMGRALSNEEALTNDPTFFELANFFYINDVGPDTEVDETISIKNIARNNIEKIQDKETEEAVYGLNNISDKEELLNRLPSLITGSLEIGDLITNKQALELCPELKNLTIEINPNITESIIIKKTKIGSIPILSLRRLSDSTGTIDENVGQKVENAIALFVQAKCGFLNGVTSLNYKNNFTQLKDLNSLILSKLNLLESITEEQRETEKFKAIQYEINMLNDTMYQLLMGLYKINDENPFNSKETVEILPISRKLSEAAMKSSAYSGARLNHDGSVNLNSEQARTVMQSLGIYPVTEKNKLCRIP